MRKLALLFLSLPLSLVSCSSPSKLLADGSQSLALEVGQRFLEDSEFESLDAPTMYGVEWTLDKREMPGVLEVGFHRHEESKRLPSTGFTSLESSELSVGLRKIFDGLAGPVEPYAGLGLSLFYTDRTNEVAPVVGQEGSDWDSGAYLRVGCTAPLSDSIAVGLDLRYVHETLFEYGGYDLNGTALTARLVWSF